MIKITTTLMLVTPEMAKEWLEKCNITNRTLNTIRKKRWQK
jgi:hypothetical protein